MGRLLAFVFAITMLLGCNNLRATQEIREAYEQRLLIEDVDEATIEQRMDECDAVETLYLVWGSTAAGASFLAGTGGISTLATDGKSQTFIGVASLVVGVVGAVSVFVSGHYTGKYHDCVKDQLQDLLPQDRAVGESQLDE